MHRSKAHHTTATALANALASHLPLRVAQSLCSELESGSLCLRTPRVQGKLC